MSWCYRNSSTDLHAWNTINFLLARSQESSNNTATVPRSKTVAADIVATVRRILRFTSRYDSGFDSVDIEAMLTLYASGKSDFNDLMLVELCKSHDLTLVTHDADFQDSDIPILTANRKLLGSRN